jgi:Fungal chitosanase of glycosyl hydrolase group 75
LSIPIFVAVLLLAGGVAIGQNVGQATPGSRETSAVADACARSVLFNFPAVHGLQEHEENVENVQNVPVVPIWQALGNQAFFFVSGMTIDADGAPNAYHPDNIGLDDLANAGMPGHWDGIITDRAGEPLLQGPEDPFPGYYVSCTSLTDRTKGRTDPARYVDASKIPYIVLPRDVAVQGGAQLGDFAVVVNLRNGKSSYAIFADVGTMGEGSIALADNLGIWSDARQGGRRGGILYLVFPGSGNRQPRTVDEISVEAAKLLQDWGGAEKLTSCSANQAPAAIPVKTPVQASPDLGVAN